MELRQLRYFIAVVDAQGLRRAGAELRVAASALSRALDQLEQHLGVKLIDRSPGGIALTLAGQEFLPRARSIVDAADAAVHAMKQHSKGSALRVGVVSGQLAAGELIILILRGFRTRWPELALQANAISSVDQVGPLLAGTVDVAIVRVPIDHPGVEVIPLALEPRALLVGASTDLAAETEVDIEDVLHEPTIHLQGSPAWSHFWQLDTERGGENVNPALPPARNLDEMHASVATGEVVISTPPAVGRLAPTATTRCVALTGVTPSVIAIARRRNDNRKIVQLFIDSAIATTRAQIARLPGAIAT